MATTKVLVLCQRKAGLINGLQRVENKTVPLINYFIKTLFAGDDDDDYEIEYLSALESSNTVGDKVDIEGVLSLKNASTNYLTLKNEGNKQILASDFIRQNEGTYQLIILNTCPFQSMDFDIIYKLLSPDGLMVFSSFPNNPSSNFSKTVNEITHIEKLFTLDEDLVSYIKRTTSFIVFVYRKNIIGGKQYKKRKLRSIKKRSIKKRSIKKMNKRRKKRNTKKNKI
jgi:hypothetical protein